MQVGNKPIHYKSWSSNEVRNVGHLMKLIRRIFYSLRIWRFFLSKQTFLLSKGWYQRLKPYGKATKKTYTILPSTTKLSHYIKFSLVKSRKKRSKLKENGSTRNPRKHWLGHSLPIIFPVHKDLKTDCPAPLTAGHFVHLRPWPAVWLRKNCENAAKLGHVGEFVH